MPALIVVIGLMLLVGGPWTTLLLVGVLLAGHFWSWPLAIGAAVAASIGGIAGVLCGLAVAAAIDACHGILAS